jgi:hypothetical protein
VLTLEDHLKIVRDWQQKTGSFGKCPPKAEFPKTSNFIQWTRKRVRDLGDRKYAAALASVGIATEKAGVNKGVSDSAQAILAFVREKRRTPDMAADSKAERHLGAWLMRMQAGVLPGNHIEVAGGRVSELVDEVIDQARAVQREDELAQQWFEFCARSHDLMPRLRRGDMWGTRLHEAAPERLNEVFPWLSAAKSSCRMGMGSGRLPLCAPDPHAVVLEINSELSSLPRAVEFSSSRSSTAALQIRLANSGLLSMGMTVEHWVARKALRERLLAA